MKSIKTVGVIGAGTMGAAIAQKIAQEGLCVILHDIEMKYVDRGMKNIRQTLDEGVQRKVFTEEMVVDIMSNIKPSDKMENLKECDLIIEAIFENLKAKTDLFGSLGKIIKDDCIVATNTSSFSVTELARSISHPERFIGLHYFYHAAKNRLVEIIPGEKTSEDTFEAVKRFSNFTGKDPILCKDINGFAVNRYFVPWLNEAVRIYSEGIASKEEIDSECMRIFGIGMGPFALMNATGVAVAFHAEKTLEVFGKLYEVSPALQKQAESGKNWDIAEAEIGKAISQNSNIISDRMLGIIFYVCSQILDESVCSPAHLNRGAKIGLRWKRGPVELMKSLGTDEVRRLVKLISEKYGMKIPGSIGESFLKIESVSLEIKDSKAIITMDQPENMNALSEETVNELSEKFDIADADKNIKTIIITGAGKAFVAGADIKFFVRNIKSNNISNIESFTGFAQKVFSRIENSGKLIVAVVNGLTLGGGLELALCADMILAYPKAQFAFPETGIGIYPGLGGTQRSVKKIGRGLSKYLIYTGKMLSAKEAEEIGLVDRIITPDEFTEILSDKKNLPEVSIKNLNDKWQKIKEFFEKNTLSDILKNNLAKQSLSSEEAGKISKTISNKAPVALKFADKLIDEAGGCESELMHIRDIFSTSDALLGLTSIGKKVQYQGK
ncbi:MAG: Fatty acid oxidation complex subunit alpha [Ignavibacteria bacterium]|nr:Fatty acid oxidation complex subunit alpha [Ignavibacteria bacterium]